MPVTTIISILQQAGTILNDDGADSGARWPYAERLGWYNEAVEKVAQMRPDAMSINTEFTPTPNQTLQNIPVDGIRLEKVLRNTAATSKKRAIRLVEQAVLDDHVRGWHNAAPTVDVENYVYDPRDPRVFYLYPPPSSLARVEIVYDAVPPKASLLAFDGTDATTICINDIYAGALLDYVLYRCYRKDAEIPANRALSDEYLSAFIAAIEGKIQGEQFMDSLKQKSDGAP